MINCPLCNIKENDFIWSDQSFALINVSNEIFPCYLRLIYRFHVAEVTDLEPHDRIRMWHLLETIENCIRETHAPNKINWAQFGNQVPHLHWHLIARWHDDDRFPASAWEPSVRYVPNELTRMRLALTERLLTHLPEILDTVD